MEPTEKQAATEATSSGSRRQAPGSISAAASKLQKVADGDKAAAGGTTTTEGKVRIARCSQAYIDALIRLETNPIRRINMDFLDNYTGSFDLRGIMLRTQAARDEIDAAHASILEQYRALGVTYTEVVEGTVGDYDPPAA